MHQTPLQKERRSIIERSRASRHLTVEGHLVAARGKSVRSYCAKPADETSEEQNK